MMSMMRDCMSMTSSYFMRSQKRTYAIDPAKNMIVTTTHKTSCMVTSSANFVMSRQSEGHPLAGSCRNPSCLGLSSHFYQFASLPGWFEFRKVNYDAGRPTVCLLQQSHQEAQLKRHRADTKQRKYHSHNAADTPAFGRLLN